jgi:hypothetical protein
VGMPQTSLLRSEERCQAGGAWRRRGVTGHDRNTQQGGRTCLGDAPKVREGGSELLVRRSGRLGRRHRDPVWAQLGPIWVVAAASCILAGDGRGSAAICGSWEVDYGCYLSAGGRWKMVACSWSCRCRWPRLHASEVDGGLDCLLLCGELVARGLLAWLE